MLESYPYYGVAEGASLSQGELFKACPYLQVNASTEYQVRCCFSTSLLRSP